MIFPAFKPKGNGISLYLIKLSNRLAVITFTVRRCDDSKEVPDNADVLDDYQ
jgi:hypothetical protein